MLQSLGDRANPPCLCRNLLHERDQPLDDLRAGGFPRSGAAVALEDPAELAARHLRQPAQTAVGDDLAGLVALDRPRRNADQGGELLLGEAALLPGAGDPPPDPARVLVPHRSSS